MYKITDLETQISNKNDCINFYSKFYYRCSDRKNIILVDADKKLFKVNNTEKKTPGSILNNHITIIKHSKFKDLQLECIFPHNNSEINLEVINNIKNSLKIKTNKSTTLTILCPVKGGFLAQYKDIKGFLPRTQMLEIIRSFVKENSNGDKPLSNMLYFLNLHNKNTTIKPKFSFNISNITVTPYFSRKNFASSSEHIFEGSLNFVFTYKK